MLDPLSLLPSLPAFSHAGLQTCSHAGPTYRRYPDVRIFGYAALMISKQVATSLFENQRLPPFATTSTKHAGLASRGGAGGGEAKEEITSPLHIFL